MPIRPQPRALGNARDAQGRPFPESLSVPAGAGARGTGGFYNASIERGGDSSGIIQTCILIDLTGLSSSTTDLDIIGVGANPAHIGQILSVESGTPIGGTIECLEAPAGGVTDIDLYRATVGTGVFDGAVTSLTGQAAVVTSGGAWTLGRVLGLSPDAVRNADFLYLAGGAAGTAAAYTAGRFLITIVGRA